MRKAKAILAVSGLALFCIWIAVAFSKFGTVTAGSMKEPHSEILGIFLPLFSFYIPKIKNKEYTKEFFWTKENLIVVIITLIINIPPVIITTYNYFKYYFG